MRQTFRVSRFDLAMATEMSHQASIADSHVDQLSVIRQILLTRYGRMPGMISVKDRHVEADYTFVDANDANAFAARWEQYERHYRPVRRLLIMVVRLMRAKARAGRGRTRGRVAGQAIGRK